MKMQKRGEKLAEIFMDGSCDSLGDNPSPRETHGLK
jgi:hypothetical protein